MFRHIFGPPRQDRQDVKHDEWIAALEEQVTRLTAQNTKLSEEKQDVERMNAELVAFLKALPESIRKSKGGAEILVQRDALVEKAEQEPTLVDCPYCHGAHYIEQRCPLNKEHP